MNKKITMINNADSFSQPSMIIFTKGANIFCHDFIYTGTSQKLEYHEKDQ